MKIGSKSKRMLIGGIISVLLLMLPFLNINNVNANLINGIPEMFSRGDLFFGTICFLIGLAPLIFAFSYSYYESLSKILVVSVCFFICTIQIIGLRAIHIEFMIYNYGKQGVLSWGYLLYVITQITMGIMNLIMVRDVLFKKGKLIKT